MFNINLKSLLTVQISNYFLSLSCVERDDALIAKILTKDVGVVNL